MRSAFVSTVPAGGVSPDHSPNLHPRHDGKCLPDVSTSGTLWQPSVEHSRIAGVVRYGEGIFVGYRSYDARGIEPMIPFGHGGSYTTFEWGGPTIRGTGTDLSVEVPITNTGDRVGSEVAQVYVAPAQSVVPRPVKELAGFAKLDLAPGATGTARVNLTDRSFARWDPAVHDWVVDPGSYSIILAASATDIRATADVTL